MDNKRKLPEMTGATPGSENTSTNHGSTLSEEPPTKKILTRVIPKVEKEEESAIVLLRHQNRELGVLMKKLTQERTQLKNNLQDAERRYNESVNLVSCLRRTWDQLDLGLANFVGQNNLHPVAKLELENLENILEQPSTMPSSYLKSFVKYTAGDLFGPSKVEAQEGTASSDMNVDDDDDDDDTPEITKVNKELQQRILATTKVMQGAWENYQAYAKRVEDLLTQLKASGASTMDPAALDKVSTFQTSMDELVKIYQAQVQETNSKLLFVVDKLKTSEGRAIKLQHQLEDLQIQMHTTRRRDARAEAQRNGFQTISSSSVLGKSATETASDAQAGTSASSSAVGTEGGDVRPSASTLAELSALQEKVSVLEKLADERLKEVETIKSEKIELAKQLASEQPPGLVSPEMVLTSRPYLELKETLVHAEFQKKLAVDESNRVKSVEQDLHKKLQAATEKIHEMETQTDKRWREYSVEQQNIVSELELKLVSLTEKLNNQEIEIKQATMYKQRLLEMEELLKSTQAHSQVLKTALEQAKNGASVKALQLKVEELTSSLAKKDFGAGDANALRAKVVELEASVASAQLENEGLKQEADTLYSEIESITAAVSSLETQHRRLIAQQSEKDSQNATLMQNQMKIDSKIRKVDAERKLLLEKSAAEAQLREDLEAKVSLLESRLMSCDTSRSRAEEASSMLDEKVRTITTELESAKLNLDASTNREGKLKEQSSKLKQVHAESTEQATNLAFQVKRLEESNASLKRKLEKAKSKLLKDSSSAQKSTGNKSWDAVKMEAQENALRCPIYRQYWKDCILTKCGHMFSEKALKDNLAKRNRKCPTCKMNYSKDDMKQIYLYQSNEYGE